MPDPWLVALSPTALFELEEISSRASPSEAVGALIGSRNYGDRRVGVNKIIPLANETGQGADRSFFVDPRRILQLEREFPGEERSVVGYFHSHPAGPNEPSSRDLQTAWREYVYILAAPRTPEGWQTVAYPAEVARLQPGGSLTKQNRGGLGEEARWRT